MKVEKIVVGELSENCHFLIEENGECLIIDPGDEGEKIAEYISENSLSLKGILLTHGHFDHIMATHFLKEKYNCPVVMGECDVEMIGNDEKNMGAYMGYHPKPFEVSKKVNDGDVVDISTFRINVIATPGHTKGSVCYLVENFLFCGDTLFKNCVGRTDLYGGNSVVLMKSLEKLKNLNENLITFSGHGESSTIAKEKQNNPWLKSIV